MTDAEKPEVHHLHAQSITTGRPVVGTPSLGEVLREVAASPSAADEAAAWLALQTDAKLASLESGKRAPALEGYTGPLSRGVIAHMAGWVLRKRGIRSERKWKIATIVIGVIATILLGALAAVLGIPTRSTDC